MLNMEQIKLCKQRNTNVILRIFQTRFSQNCVIKCYSFILLQAVYMDDLKGCTHPAIIQNYSYVILVGNHVRVHVVVSVRGEPGYYEVNILLTFNMSKLLTLNAQPSLSGSDNSARRLNIWY